MSATQTAREDLGELARAKLQRVLGTVKGAHAFEEALTALGLDRISTPEDLYAVGQHLSKRLGFEAAVGRLLCVAAVVRGATSG